MFGVWTTAKELSFEEGNFELVKCDLRTSDLIDFNYTNRNNTDDDESEEKFFRSRSTDKLIVDDEALERKKLLKHELNNDYIDQKPKMKAIYDYQYSLLKAREEVFFDGDGKLAIKLRQDTTKIKLRKLDVWNPKKTYPLDHLILVEYEIEEPMEFFPSIVLMSLKRYAYLLTSFLELVKPERTKSRKRVDVYKYMFFCDFFNFLILVFGFAEFAVSR